jgi:hypothetical protein
MSGQTLQHIFEISHRFKLIEFGGLKQRHDICSMLACSQATAEQPILEGKNIGIVLQLLPWQTQREGLPLSL